MSAIAWPIVQAFNVRDTIFGALGDGSTNDRAAIQAAITAAIAAGGGTIFFPPGEYVVTGHSTVSLPVPVVGPNFTTANQNLDAHFYLLNAEGIRFVGHNAVIRSTKTDAGFIFLCNGCRDVVFDGIAFQSPAVVSGGVASPAGVHGVGFTSTAQNSERIVLRNARFAKVYAAIYIFGDPAGSYRVRGVHCENISCTEAVYGIAAHDNGDLVSFLNVRTDLVGRSYFVYGVDQHCGTLDIQTGNSLDAILIKAYDRDTTNIALRVHSRKTTGSTATLSFGSQHAPATQPLPKVVSNVSVWFDDTGSTSANSINFLYHRDTVLTPTCASTIFTNIVLAGSARGIVSSDVLQTPAGTLDANGLLLPSGLPNTTLYTQGGFRSLTSYVTSLEAGGGSGSTSQLFLGLLSPTRPSIYTNATLEIVYAANIHRFFDVGASGENARIDRDSTAGNTRMLIYDVDNGTLERVSVGAPNSGGAGFKLLRIPN